MSVHRDHAVRFNLRAGWYCEACPFAIEDTDAGRFAAMGHVVAHQYRVAPPKPFVDDRTIRHCR